MHTPLDNNHGLCHDTRMITLYRLYTSDDRLLWVGVSKYIRARLSKHVQTASWAKDISYATLEYFVTEDEALAAERKAIAIENPLHNIRSNPTKPKQPRPPVYKLKIRKPRWWEPITHNWK